TAAVVAITHPGNGEIAVRVDGDLGGVLIIGTVVIDPKFRAQGSAACVVITSIHVIDIAVSKVAEPGDHRATVRGHVDAGNLLVAFRTTVDPEFAAHAVSRSIEALGIDIPAASVESVVRPGDHDITGRMHRRRRLDLIA